MRIRIQYLIKQNKMMKTMYLPTPARIDNNFRKIINFFYRFSFLGNELMSSNATSSCSSVNESF
ncbi:hypothetical protein HanXRQr2_Chr03g0119561 [Helianthus annuus]|uniref:Uncharacterized protein n=1 Tax=Helianthus annuus TaxID=4232 RepID=A0A9K3NVT2_HELAN|nr:hypothetical protein HanXRQr2_Chr03g0119561 [Helianthus annuus]KAJ0944375.1 hypothetical protein HanPSC8_Chr03g0116071 [Helianthus annuus]